ncbi:MAG: hypothetical protein FWD36_09360 [Treponema sp.]|nr:hypothetical protein [Treponema sp.]
MKKTIMPMLFLCVCIAAPSMAMPNDYIPRYAVEYAEEYKSDFLRTNSQAASDLQYRFFYNAKGEACLEFTVIPKGRYTWSTPTWVGYIWGNSSGSIGLNGIRYTMTRQLADAAEYRMEERRKDPVFQEIEKIVLQLAIEYDYDFQSLGMPVRYRSPNVKRAVCDGYASAAVNAFRDHPLVHNVETWVSAVGNHAWNVLILHDGRKLYCDVTWYDGNTIDNEGYVVNVPQRSPVNLTFDIDEFNSLGGAVHGAHGRTISVHFGWPDAQLK